MMSELDLFEEKTSEYIDVLTCLAFTRLSASAQLLRHLVQ